MGHFCTFGQSHVDHCRQVACDYRKDLGIPVEEKNLGRYEAMTADEIFITSTTKALCWARTWEGQPVGDGQSYPMYDQLMAAWKAHVGIDFVAQAHDYHGRLEDWVRKDRNKHRDQQAVMSTGGGLVSNKMQSQHEAVTELIPYRPLIDPSLTPN